MKNVSFFLLLCITALNIHAQVTVNDSVTTAPGNTDMVFYQLATGQKTTASNTDWHLALSVRPSAFPDNTLQGATLRINEALGLSVYQIPGFTQDSFNVVVDTTGYLGWNQLHDSDSSMDMGALNNGLNIAFFNYGWGVYGGAPAHNVVGKKIYLFVFPDGSMKKLFVNKLDRDTAWDISYANLDNSDLQSAHVSKTANAGKNFMYLNLLDNVVHDKEPLSANWDLQFLKYAATDVMPGSIYPVVGCWTNKGDSVAEAYPYNAWALVDPGNIPFSANMSTIGWDWKQYDNQNHVYTLRDSLSYFIKTNSGRSFKLIFTGYGGSTTGVISFYLEEVVTGTGIAEKQNEMNLTVFPNPSSSVFNITMDNTSETELKVTDINGRLINSIKTSSNHLQLNTAEMESGVYMISVTSGNAAAKRKFVVAH